ncbi:astacin-like protein [Dinothrombium tinctorium]|uniref:Astacin-like protein n=1 Tax=Dinothrombium tinctorium TaxID=1965070 RepID=A0A3S3P2B8_9ACAR|nr:astacin-like protein [Dinothrombium tinctorium]RWR99841.1 astacin-like protein [Dinothrombium tinctorium]RWR99885.1 astacin-like protein [Dinothrombium tinctorium]
MFVEISLLAIICSISCSTSANPIKQKFRRALENPNLFEGDIILKNNDRFAVPFNSNLWPSGVVPYVISIELEYLRFDIEIAMRHIESKTCIRFKERTGERNYIRIFKGDG